MTLDPVLPVWMIVLVCGAMVVFAVVQFTARRSSRGSWHWLARAGLAVLVAGMALRPGLPGNHQPPAASGDVDVYFVVDTTSSMAAEDFGDGEPRLVGVRADVEAMATELRGARYSLISFDAVTVQRLPLTTDTSAIVSGAKALNQEITYYSSGSSISQPVEFLVDLLEDDQAEHPERQRVLYYLGDGEQTVAEPPASFEPVAPFIDGGAVLGYGTPEGGPMKQFTGFDDGDAGEYITLFGEGGSEPAISSIDEPALETIAGQLGVRYVHREEGDSVAPVIEGVRVSHVTAGEQPPLQTPEFYWLIAIAFGVLALTELPVLVSALRELGATRRRGVRDGT